MLLISLWTLLGVHPTTNASEATVPTTVASLFVPELAASGSVSKDRDDAAKPVEAVRDAQARLAAKDYEGTAHVLLEHLKHARGDGLVHDLLAQALEKLDRLDESAHHFEAAARAYAIEGKELPSRNATSGLRRTDPLSARREGFEKKLVADLLSAAEELQSQGHALRALDVAEHLEPLTQGKDVERLKTLLAAARATFEEVDLDRAASSTPAGAGDGAWPLCQKESVHYKLACNLEPELVERLGQVMDDVHAHYVEVYFDGDAKKAKAEKATIRIVPNRAEMLKLWQGGGPGPEGWWSPGTNEVITYDVRTRKAEVDEMLVTLFHEASHQFMTLASGGGFVPAWINEGTASFFEGTHAMADHRVLWPDAALGRLYPLVAQLKSGKEPTALTVVSYDSPASYPPEYYSFGWGLVYFLQEYEDEATLVHVYRPLYARYKTEIVKRGGDPLGLFAEIFLGKRSPLGHQRFPEFDRDWSAWIQEKVYPLYGASKETRALRLARVAKYVAAAQAAKGEKKAPVSEEELLSRALGDVEYVRSRIDGDEHPDGELIVQQSEILERLKRPAAAAPLVQKALDLADAGTFAIDAARYTELEKRLAKLDRRNAALRNARSKLAGLARSAKTLLDDYRARGDASVLRGYTFAAECGAALDDDAVLLAAAKELRETARERGLLSGSIFALEAAPSKWTTIHSEPKAGVSVAQGRVSVESVRCVAFVDPDVELTGEYEVRAKLVRDGKVELGSAFGVVAAARPSGDWTMVGVDERGQVGVWTATQSARKGVSTTRTATLVLERPVAQDEDATIAVRVAADGRMIVKVGDRAPVEARIALDPSLARHVGIFSKNGRTVLEDLVVEQFP